jgi:hypothetical protein
MSLIIVRQTPTGIYFQMPPIPENEVFEALIFNTITKLMETSAINGGSAFELEDGQLIWTDPDTGDEYFYDSGSGDVVVIPSPEPPAPPTFTFAVFRNPLSAGTAVNLSPAASYTAGSSIDILATPNAGWSFVRWTIAGAEVSTSGSFTFTMPAANTTIVAQFEPVVIPPDPDPSPSDPSDPIAVHYYPLELRVNGIQIPIASITPKLDTGIFKSDLIGDYSYPITVSIAEEVMVALGLPNDPQSAWEYIDSISAELWAHGNRRYRGHLDILDADDKAVKMTFVLDSGFFIDRYKDLSIRSTYAESDVILLNPPTQVVGGHELRFNFRDVRLSVNATNRLFVKAQYENHILMLEAIADWLEASPFNLQVRIEYSEDLTDESSRIIVWDTTIITTITLQVTSGTSRFTRARRLTNTRFVMDQYYPVSEDNRIAFPTVYNRELYEGNNPLHDGIVNRYDALGRLYVGNVSYFAFSESFRWENVIVPYIYLTDVVKTIFGFLKIQVSGSFFDDDRVKRMLLYNNRTLDFLQVTLNGTPSRRTALAIHAGDDNPDQESYRYENIHDLSIRLRNHVPDVTVTEFLKAMKNYFFLKYDFNILQNRVEIRFVRDVIRDMEVLDFTRKAGRVYTLEMNKESGLAFTYENPDPILQDGNSGGLPSEDYAVNNYLAMLSLDAELGEVALVRSLNAYFRLTADQDNPPFWKLIAFRQQDDGDTDRKRSWSVGMVPLVDAFIDGRKMPSIEMTANQPEANLSNEDTGIRIMAYYGRQLDAANQPYAFASCTRFNARELADASQSDLDLRSEDQNPFYKDLERIIRGGKIYESNILLSESDIEALSKTRRIRIGNIDYLIDDMEILNTERDFAIAKPKMWKIKS